MDKEKKNPLADRPDRCRLRSTAPLAIPARRPAQGCKPSLSCRAGMLGHSCTIPAAPRAGGGLREEDGKGPARGRVR